jgi:hypothetical protein
LNYRRYVLCVVFAIMFSTTPLLAEGTTIPGMIDPSNDDDPGITETCWVCRGSYNFDTGEERLFCGKPDSGGWGNQQCETGEVDTDHLYCISYGDSCCVN